MMNKIKISAALRFMLKPCYFIRKIRQFMKISSVLINEVLAILKETYDVDSLFENDLDAILARIHFVQRHEQQMRLAW